MNSAQQVLPDEAEIHLDSEAVSRGNFEFTPLQPGKTWAQFRNEWIVVWVEFSFLAIR